MPAASLLRRTLKQAPRGQILVWFEIKVTSVNGRLRYAFPSAAISRNRRQANPNPVGFLERGRLFAERRSYSNVSVLNRPRSTDRATFKCRRNLFPDNRLSHSGVPRLSPPNNRRSSREGDP